MFISLILLACGILMLSAAIKDCRQRCKERIESKVEAAPTIDSAVSESVGGTVSKMPSRFYSENVRNKA